MTNQTDDNVTDLLALIHETKAVSVWNHKTGPVFWYAAGVPGPFYVNTELIIGPQLSKYLLQSIDTILMASNDPAVRADQLHKNMMDHYQKTPAYQTVIAALITKAKAEFLPLAKDEFLPLAPTLLSGGERRDWLFSIPLAHELGLRHAYLFKNLTCYVPHGFKPGELVFHVSDLINNAASYFDLWLPALDRAKLSYSGTLSVNSRGENGITRLKKHGQKVVTLNSIDLNFFTMWLKKGLISEAVCKELACFFSSEREWAAQYLLVNHQLFDVDNLDKKSFGRLQFFFTQDPWQLRKGHETFFAEMHRAIEARLARAA